MTGLDIGHGRMFVSHHLDGDFMQYALYLGIVAIFGYGILYFLRKRRERRDEAQVAIPCFFNGATHPGDDVGRRVETEWIEFLPSRNRK